MKKQLLLMSILTTVTTMWTGTAQAQTKYDLYIAGTQVTSDNCNDLSKIKGVTGKVKYDNATKTLTLDNATISNTADEDYNGSGVGIDNKTDGLTIHLIGNNTVTSEKSVGVWNADGKTLTFTNDGSLKVKGSTASSDAYYQSGIFNYGTITVNNCTIEATGGAVGIAFGYWKFDNCNVRAKGGGKSEDVYIDSISYMWGKQPEFKGCAITAPAGNYWEKIEAGDDNFYSLFGTGEKVITDWVTITKGATGIDKSTTDTAIKDNRGIYTLQGVRLSDKFESLPKNIYIVNGQKVVKK